MIGIAAAHRDLLGAENFLDRLGPPGASLDGGVVGDDDGLAPVDAITTASHDARGRSLAVVLIVCDEQPDLEHARLQDREAARRARARKAFPVCAASRFSSRRRPRGACSRAERTWSLSSRRRLLTQASCFSRAGEPVLDVRRSARWWASRDQRAGRFPWPGERPHPPSG